MPNVAGRQAEASAKSLAALGARKIEMRTIFVVLLLALLVSGCAGLKMKDGGLVIGKDTTATVDEPGVARVTNQF